VPIASIKQHPLFHTLNNGQKIASMAAMEKGNMLICGGGGVGKSHLIRILTVFIPNLVLTASTGIAAINILGQTLDSFMGFNASITTPQKASKMDKTTKERLALVEVLLIDETSMTRADKLDMVDKRLRAAKENFTPFGGVKIILVGDFCQLPPIVSNKPSDILYQKMYQERLFAFEADCYEMANFTPYILNEYVRHGDYHTRRVLRNMRMGHKLDDVISFINANANGHVNAASLRICKTNQKVKDINEYQFSKLKGRAVAAHGVIEGHFPLSLCPADNKLVLKQYCKLIVTINKPEHGYQNGDLGTLMGFNKHYLVVKLDRGNTVLIEPHEWKNHNCTNDGGQLTKGSIGSFTQYPVRLGYAITGHKSQGMTLDSAVVDFSGEFNADGLAYVVFSRVKSLNNLQIMSPLRVSDIRVSQKARNFTFKTSMLALNRMSSDLIKYNIEDLATAA
jgi:ATP-dependent DNA helicase PIF1